MTDILDDLHAGRVAFAERHWQYPTQIRCSRAVRDLVMDRFHELRGDPPPTPYERRDPMLNLAYFGARLIPTEGVEGFEFA